MDWDQVIAYTLTQITQALSEIEPRDPAMSELPHQGAGIAYATGRSCAQVTMARGLGLTRQAGRPSLLIAGPCQSGRAPNWLFCHAERW
jgi:hypothetical protein